MKLKDAIKYAIAESEPEGLDDEELYQVLVKMAANDYELLEDWRAQDQEELRRKGRTEALSRKRYIAKESKR